MNQKPLLFFLLSATIAAALAADPVLDTNGSPVKPDVEYNLNFATTATGGALSIASRNKTCPPTISVVVKSRRHLSITIVSPNPVKAINVNDNINFKFLSLPKIPLCGEQSAVWRGEKDTFNGKTFITTGGQERSLDNSVAGRSWFQIQSSGKKNYKLAYCPRDCRACIVPCYDIGIVKEGGMTWFGIGGEAAPVSFEKANGK